MGTVVFADLLAITHRIAIRYGQRLQIVRRVALRIFGPVGPDLMDITLLGSQLLLQEYGQIDLPHETDSLRILALGRSEFLLLGQSSHLRFQQMADREDGSR